MTNDQLLQAARTALAHSYHPYSQFAVGAALLCEDGTVYTGCNIENAAYSATVCAERTAFFKAIGDGKRQFKKIAVVGTVDPCYPCGVCRQVMAEFCNEAFEIVLQNKNGEAVEYTLSQLLPHSFEL